MSYWSQFKPLFPYTCAMSVRYHCFGILNSLNTAISLPKTRRVISTLIHRNHRISILAYSKMSKIQPNPAKSRLRDEIATRIAALSTEEKKRQSKVVFEKLINHPYYKSSKRISLFMSTDQEIDTAPMIDHIRARGAAAFVPQYAGGVMRMLRLENGDEQVMPLTKHGIQQHGKEQPRENALESGGLDLVIAPGVAFSKSGDRLGHGGGYYDRFLAGLRANPETAPKVLAVAFDVQVVDNVPMDPQDQKIDAVIYAE